MLDHDFHSHLMPGVDDGSKSPVETVAMARGLVEIGVKRVTLTPHQFRLGNSFSAAELQRRTEEVTRLLEGAGVPLEVRCGAEHFYGEELLDAVGGRGELVPFDRDGLSHLLVELPLNQPAVGVRRFGEALVRRGLKPVLAHPERTAGLSRARS
ncbi:MAG: CpsB/CapC family capsule biosynthesis tyrosine phosphatase, partial [Planctomycetota bacterium]